ncbi:TetR/AcrR family transcriptional regulator [Blastococcus tunisiensis]|uniref:Regulatory protein, tetR family n=1 Tax=Blastococcus tunisiensis TaxID=1798228 RepID=A0A1I2BWH9_9ACTN|nr:helix-turn-helix domain-containing protein [Blastococcus sp. DSM 46838]SFE60437.1 regulatory protein, tetR family [Blastococcus sp. DSM 46838]
MPPPLAGPSPWAGPVHLPGAHTRSGNAMGRTRLGLLAGAGRAFAEHGVRRSTMQSIAAAAGVAKATLYNHFRTKDEVVAALVAVELDRLTALADGRTPADALAALSDELGAHPVLRRLADTEPGTLTGLLAMGADRWAELTGRLAGALGVDGDSAELAGRWLLGIVLQPGRSTTRHRQAARLAALLVPSGDGAQPAAGSQV